MANLTKSASEDRDRAAGETKTVSAANSAGSSADRQQAVQQKIERLAESGEQAAKNLQRDLRNAPGAAQASPQATEAASRALDDLAAEHQKQLDRLAVRPTATLEATDQRSMEADNVAASQRSDREQAMRVLTDANVTPDQRAEQLQDLARDAAATLGTENERIEPTTVTPDEKPTLDTALSGALGAELADSLPEGANERMAGALKQDLGSSDELTRLTQQIRDELLQSQLTSGTDIRFASEAIERLTRGHMGERLAADALAKQGYEIASYKPDVSGTNQGGIDIVALKRDEEAEDGATQEERLHLIDNKALTRDGNVTSVSALTTNLQQNIRAVADEFQKLHDAADSTAEQRDVAARVLDAIKNDRITLAVTNANIARDGQFTTDTAGKAQDLEFVDVVKVDPAQKVETDPVVDPRQRAQYGQQAQEPAARQAREVTAAAVDAAAKAFAAAWQAQHAAEVEALAAARRADDEARAKDESAQP